MNELKIFENTEFGSIRTVEVDGEPWLVGKDVALALGYSNTKDALSTHVEDEDKRQGDGVTIRDSIGREQHPTIINESGLYALVLRSKLPTARKFRRWVTSEVLPSVRKHGAYLTEETLEQAILNPDIMIRLCTTLKEERDKRKRLEAENTALVVENQIMEPMEICHGDGDPSNNRLTNLRYDTRAENCIDEYRLNRSPRVKLTDDQVREIRKKADGGAGTIELANQYGVLPSIISAVRHRKTYRWVT